MHIFLDLKTKVNFIESQKVPVLLISATGQFHVQVRHNLHNLNSTLQGKDIKKGSQKKNREF